MTLTTTDVPSELTGPFFRDALAGLDGVVHLYSGAEGPALHAHRDAALRYLDDKSAGDAGRQRSEAELDRCRVLVAELLGGDPDAVAVLGNASDAIHRLTGSIPFRSGDNVVTTDLEFPSAVLTALALRRQGVELRLVHHRDGALETDDFAAAIDDRTALVIASHSSYVNGSRVDAEAIHGLARAAGAAFVLDATQSLGVLGVEASHADAVVSSSYKWLLGPHGLGFLHLTRPEAFPIVPDAAGWRSVDDLFAADRYENIHLFPTARRLELGFPNYLGVYLVNESFRLLRSVEGPVLEQYVAQLCGQLVDELAAAGATLLSPADPARRSANISVAADRGDTIAARMLESGVRVWGGDGRVRFSVHGFNSAEDIAAGVRAFRDAR
jgi:cysteine desulfurase/selenocysteine lyase